MNACKYTLIILFFCGYYHSEVRAEGDDNVEIKKVEDPVGFLKVSFKEVDTNKDGYVEKQELIPWMEKGFAKLAQMETTWLFDKQDKNKDNKLTLDEILLDNFKKTSKQLMEEVKSGKLTHSKKSYFIYEKSKFTICDKNMDGFLSRNEHFYHLNSGVYLPKFEVDMMYVGYDVNKDGKITFEDEFYNPDEVQEGMTKEESKASDKSFFDERDLNKDGVLDYDEIKEMIIPDRHQQALDYFKDILAQLDNNKDEKLSKEEFMKGTDLLTLFEGNDVQPPTPDKNDVKGPPNVPDTSIDFKLFRPSKKDPKETKKEKTVNKSESKDESKDEL